LCLGFIRFQTLISGNDNRAHWQVVKNVATTSLEVKKLVYIYLVHYAEKYDGFSLGCCEFLELLSIIPVIILLSVNTSA
jgi:vesicle coat complex subunit